MAPAVRQASWLHLFLSAFFLWKDSRRWEFSACQSCLFHFARVLVLLDSSFLHSPSFLLPVLSSLTVPFHTRLRGPKLQVRQCPCPVHRVHLDHLDPLVDHFVDLHDQLKPHVNLGRLQSRHGAHHLISHHVIILISHHIIQTYLIFFEPAYPWMFDCLLFCMLPMLPAGRNGSPTWTDPSVETTKRLQGSEGISFVAAGSETTCFIIVSYFFQGMFVNILLHIFSMFFSSFNIFSFRTLSFIFTYVIILSLLGWFSKVFLNMKYGLSSNLFNTCLHVFTVYPLRFFKWNVLRLYNVFLCQVRRSPLRRSPGGHSWRDVHTATASASQAANSKQKNKKQYYNYIISNIYI